MDNPSLDQLLQVCKDARVVECLSKLSWKGSKLQRCLFSKTNKDTLCDSLIFIAETLFVSTSMTEEMQQCNDDSTSHTQLQPTQSHGETEETEETEEEEENQSQPMTNLDDNRPTCKLFLENRCPTGIKGLKCTHHHPKQCRKFLQGGRTEHGCQDWKCPLLHPRLCRNSYLFGSCHRTGCKERHTKHQQQPTKQPENRGDQAFLWQKQIQEQIDKLANTNLQILQVLSQCQQRPIQVWNQASHQQQSSLLPSLPKWPATNGQ